ncbi:hypothetical protein WCQ02_31255 [Paraburkholderia tropica]|uniref:hypothetical protein n=1 Tax=Paraburkholderia tropica TaxID=92647 RepID=UPI003017DA07
MTNETMKDGERAVTSSVALTDKQILNICKMYEVFGDLDIEFIYLSHAIIMANDRAKKFCAIAQPVQQTAQSDFKNFHRLLCERFGYVHDEKDWQRDQLSLIEWISARAASPQSGEKTTFDGVGGIEAAKEAIAAHMRGVTGGDTFTGYVRKELAGDFAVALARAMPPTIVTGVFECAARKQGSAGGNDPADCDWPACGCDEHANRVIAALEESGALNQASTERMSDAAVDAAIEG